MNRRPEEIGAEAAARLEKAESIPQVAEIRREYIGRKGILTAMMREMKNLPEQERAAAGRSLNMVREDLEKKALEVQNRLEEQALQSEAFDVTEPGTRRKVGHRHPITQVMEEVQNLFMGMGYEVMEGPEVEYDYYNFEALNIPDDHPLKEEQDTFYINPSIVLRTQTTSVEIRAMEQRRPPICAIATGRVFRSRELSANQSPVFHQVEGVVIDRNITFSDLKGTMALLARQLFTDATRVKFRPYKFPYNEPSAKMDVTCFRCGGESSEGCPVCGGEGWIEILGCGMIHPKVLSMSGIDPEVYSGFGFGMDIEQIVMLQKEIDDMRLLYENDESFLGQF